MAKAKKTTGYAIIEDHDGDLSVMPLTGAASEFPAQAEEFARVMTADRFAKILIFNENGLLKTGVRSDTVVWGN